MAQAIESCTLVVLSKIVRKAKAFWGQELRQRIIRSASCVSQAVFLSLLLAWSAQAQQVAITGVVQDATGAAISGAQVTLRSSGSIQTTTTSVEGRFSFTALSNSSGTVRVVANGFAPAERSWPGTSEEAQLNFVLRGVAQGERVVVSATRTELKLSEVPGSAVELSPEDLSANAGLTLDDVLRQVPGFSLFRRSSSRVANPTTQGVSLRGLGASGPSRALVLEDGVPLVDPFGGWVYWDRIPRAELSSVEVFRGGESSLYGSDALGGVIQFLTRVPTGPSFSVDTSYGTENTPDLSAWAGTKVSRWDFEAATDMSRTDGYILVPASQRGMVDTAANSKHATVDAGMGYQISDTGRAFLRGTFFDESRNNGTPLQRNSTGTGVGTAGINTGVGEHDSIIARVSGQVEGYDQTFSSIVSNRNSETLTDIQHVPSQEGSAAAQWNHELKNQTLIGGADVQEVMGASDEQLFSSKTGAHFANNIAGGRQRSTGIFGEDIFRIASKWTVIAGARWDDWKNFNGNTVRIALPAGTAAGQLFPSRSETSFSPRLSLMRNLGGNAAVWVAGYRAFRAPTLNELYRSFRQGSTVTNNNPLLRAERLTGAETGVRATAFNQKFESRATVFWADIVNPVTNVTLSSTPTLTTRERENLGRIRSLGGELDGVVHVSNSIQISAGYQFTHAYVVDSTRSLVGKLVPEVPKQQLTWEARYWNPTRIMLSVEGRFASSQFDDDLNTLVLGRYYVMDLFAGRQFRRGFVAYAAVENLLNQRYPVAIASPIQNLGPPILARIGLRYDFPTR
ncbi:MAG: TonB-dependent receptor [Acidobacteriaceae bacterium]|nr:TonB-dependent receptor [Acidobacteriaceae bacterium]